MFEMKNSRHQGWKTGRSLKFFQQQGNVVAKLYGQVSDGINQEESFQGWIALESVFGVLFEREK